MATPRLLTLTQLSEQTGLPAAWLRREADEGKLPCLRVGRSRMFDIEAVLKALADRKDHEVRTAPELRGDPKACLADRAAVKGVKP